MGGKERENLFTLESCGPFPHLASRQMFMFTLLIYYTFFFFFCLVKERSLSLRLIFQQDFFNFEFSLGKCRVCQ